MPKREPPKWDLVLKRNSVERLKRELFPTELWGQWQSPGRHLLRKAARRGHRPPAMVRAVPRQAEDRNLHDAGQDSRRNPDARRACAPSVKSPSSLAATRANLTTRQNIQLHYITLDRFPEVFEKLKGAGPDHAGRMRRRGAQYHRMPGGRRQPGRAFRRDRPAVGGGRLFLRQPRLFRPAPQAQDHHFGVPLPMQRAGNQLRGAGRVHQGRDPGIRGAGRRRTILDPAPVAPSGRIRAARRGDGAAAGNHRRLAIDHRVPDLAGQGAAEVHDRRLRTRRIPQAGGGASGPGIGAAGRVAAARSRRRPHGYQRAAARGPLLRWFSRVSRNDEREPDAPGSRDRRELRRRYPAHPAPEFHPDRRFRASAWTK